MEIARIWHAVKSRWLVIAFCALVAVSLTAVVSIVGGIKYAANMELLVTASGGGFGTTSEYVYNAERLSAARAPTYAELIQNREVLTRTAVRTKQGVTADDIQQGLNVRTTRDIPIVRVTYVDRDPRRAADVATNLEAVFADYVGELEGSDGVDVAVSPVNSYPQVTIDGSVANRLLLAGLFGFLLGLAAAVVLERLDVRIRTGRELADVGAPYVGSVRVDPRTSEGWEQKYSADDYRRLAVGLAVLARQAECSRLLVTGVGSPQVISNVAHGLAAYLAETGMATLLISARADLAEASGDDSPTGLTDLLAEGGRVHDLVRYGTVVNLGELSVGRDPMQLQSLLIGRDFAPLTGDLESLFDFVVIDAPPPTASPTGVAIASLACSSVVVGVANRNRRAEVDELASVLDGLGVPPRAMVLAEILDENVREDKSEAPQPVAAGR